MISNSSMQITLLSFLFKKFNIIKRESILMHLSMLTPRGGGGGGSGKGWGFDESGGPMGRDLD
jgi:hypothetical protein